MNQAQLRIGDTEREQAAAALGEHFAEGRLSADEYDERLDRVWASRTRADLAPVFRDLPSPRDRRGTTDRGYWTGAPRILPGPLLLVLGVLLVLTVLTHLPFVLLGVLVTLFVVSRRRNRRAARPRLGWR